MSDIDLDAFLASLPAHSDQCEWMYSIGRDCDCSVTKMATALVAEVRRYREGPTFTSVVHDCCVIAQDVRALCDPDDTDDFGVAEIETGDLARFYVKVNRIMLPAGGTGE